MPLKQTLSRHWFSFQRELFPWPLGPLGERYERLVRVVELGGWRSRYSRGWRGRQGRRLTTGADRNFRIRSLPAGAGRLSGPSYGRRSRAPSMTRMQDLPSATGVKRSGELDRLQAAHRRHRRRHSGQLPADVSLGARQSGGDPAGEAARGTAPSHPALSGTLLFHLVSANPSYGTAAR